MPSFYNALDRWFKISENGSTVGTEVRVRQVHGCMYLIALLFILRYGTL